VFGEFMTLLQQLRRTSHIYGVVVGCIYTYPKRALNETMDCKVKADAKFKPEEYIRYFEDFNFAANAEIVFMVSFRARFYKLLQLVTSLKSILPDLDLCSVCNMRSDPRSARP